MSNILKKTAFFYVDITTDSSYNITTGSFYFVLRVVCTIGSIRKEYFMARNYKKEIAWSKERYRRFDVRIPHEQGEFLTNYLKENNLSINAWITGEISKLQSNEKPLPVEETYEQIYKELRKQIDEGLKETNELLEEVQSKKQATLYLTYQQVAELKGVSREVVRNATRRGKLEKTVDGKIKYEDAINWSGIG